MMSDSSAERDNLYYDPYDYAIDAQAQTVWRRLRDDSPLYWNEKYGFYALSRYDDVLRAPRYRDLQLRPWNDGRGDGTRAHPAADDDIHGSARTHLAP